LDSVLLERWRGLARELYGMAAGLPEAGTGLTRGEWIRQAWDLLGRK